MFLVLSIMPTLNAQKRYDYRLVLTYLAEAKQVLLKIRFVHLYNQPSLYIMLDIIGRLPICTCPCIPVVMM
ncbi:hypothetical protein HanIR_Chr17g0866751 [Helianthus annuus]|nr:hypothetical protein HanIR_Chr17g0866751 [Helianthus annuus]